MEILIAFYGFFGLLCGAVIGASLGEKERIKFARKVADQHMIECESIRDEAFNAGRESERLELCMERYELEFQYRATFDIDEYLDALNWRWIDD